MLTESQKEAIAKANSILETAGLEPAILYATDVLDLSKTVSQSSSSSMTINESLDGIPSWQQRPSIGQPFSAEDRASKRHIINRQCMASTMAEHSRGIIVEYPEVTSQPNSVIVHRFAIDPDNFYHPKFNIQYSLSGQHSSQSDVFCGLLLSDAEGKSVYCQKLTAKCNGLKVCEHYSPTYKHPDTVTSREIVFMKTLSFFAAATNTCCGLARESEVDVVCEYDSDTSEYMIQNDDNQTNCEGKLILVFDRSHRACLQCEFRGKDKGSHLVLRNLQEFDMHYLLALLQNQQDLIRELEMQAKAEGFGPLAACSFAGAPSEKKQECPYWHREKNGDLLRGSLQKSSDCPVSFVVYTPNDLHCCPFIVIICRSTHNHPDPIPVKTPPFIANIFKSLLLELDWKLADATPRKIMIDSGFVQSLRRHLGWAHMVDPCLSDLHPSLGNLDHVRRFITDLRKIHFPNGTGFNGVLLLVQAHKNLPPNEQYVRCAETYQIENNKVFELVICMSQAMSGHLMNAVHISIDTSFKRVHGKWQEFQIETWDPSHMKSVVGAWAFITSQSAQAHFILFTRIFEIAEVDTGIPVRFHHIHGCGFQTWIADAHKGQALGAGMFCQKLCQQLSGNCLIETSRFLKDLSPYDHLRRFFRLCTVHFKRNIHELRSSISSEVLSAMYSIISSESLVDFEGTCRIIANGGPKAAAWLKDKVDAKFVIPAIYRPHSLISHTHWLASPPSTNGNEQSHRNVNRDGIDLTLLGGISRGLQYDFRSMASLQLHTTHGIYSRDQYATDYRRSQTSITRQAAVQRRIQDKKPLSQQAQTTLTHPRGQIAQTAVSDVRYHPYHSPTTVYQHQRWSEQAAPSNLGLYWDVASAGAQAPTHPGQSGGGDFE